MKRRCAALQSTLLVFAMIGAAPLEALAFDLTGTWVGKLRCNGIDREKFSYTREDVLFISQHSASELYLHFQSDGGFSNPYTGALEESNADPEGRGIVAFHRCFTYDANQGPGLQSRWLWTGTGRVNPDNGSGSLRLNQTHVTGAGAPTATIVECVGSFSRLSDRNPGVDPCR